MEVFLMGIPVLFIAKGAHLSKSKDVLLLLPTKVLDSGTYGYHGDLV